MKATSINEAMCPAANMINHDARKKLSSTPGHRNLNRHFPKAFL